MTREELNQEKQQEIFTEQKDEKRRKTTIFFFILSFCIILCFLAFYLYTTYVSTKILSVREYRIVNEKVPNSFNGLKIIQFSDLHYGTTVFISEIKNLVKEINARTPDIVVFTGDLIDINYDLKTEEQEIIIRELNKITASLGKYAVSGEEDNELFFTIMKQSNFEVLSNSYELVYKDDASPIMLIGIDSYLSNRSNMEEAFKYYSDSTHNSNVFSIAILHEPDNADNLLDEYNVTLALAGHSHNGSIRIPFVGGIYKYDGAKKYIDAHYIIDNTELFISGGIGTNGSGIRLFCRPSINFFRISNT